MSCPNLADVKYLKKDVLEAKRLVSVESFVGDPQKRAIAYIKDLTYEREEDRLFKHLFPPTFPNTMIS